MSENHDELMRRLLDNRMLLDEDERQQDLADIRGWYMDQVIAHEYADDDLSPLEKAFLRDTARSYLAWRAQHN
jgi:hypothetical protein